MILIQKCGNKRRLKLNAPAVRPALSLDSEVRQQTPIETQHRRGLPPEFLIQKCGNKRRLKPYRGHPDHQPEDDDSEVRQQTPIETSLWRQYESLTLKDSEVRQQTPIETLYYFYQLGVKARFRSAATNAD